MATLNNQMVTLHESSKSWNNHQADFFENSSIILKHFIIRMIFFHFQSIIHQSFLIPYFMKQSSMSIMKSSPEKRRFQRSLGLRLRGAAAPRRCMSYGFRVRGPRGPGGPGGPGGPSTSGASFGVRTAGENGDGWGKWWLFPWIFHGDFKQPYLGFDVIVGFLTYHES